MESVGRMYLDATEALIRGDAGEAVELLGQTPETSRGPEWRLALAKAYLALSRPAEAAPLLEEAASDTATDPGTRAYLLLLQAAALAGTQRADEALARLDEVVVLDSRLERPARALGRRIRAGEPPVVTL
jgi:hypothetical protein